CALLLVAGCGDDGALPVDAGADALDPPSCDDHNPCTSDRPSANGLTCVHDPVPNCCGNGIVEAGEACGDGNRAPLDRCSAQCTIERALVMDHIESATPGGGCDLDGNGTIDEALNNAMNEPARSWMNSWLSNDLQKQMHQVLFVFTGLTDATAQ